MDYLKIRKNNRRASAVYFAIAYLCLVPDEILDLMDLPASLRSQINEIKAEDDSYGMGAAAFAFFASNADLTDQDRLVVGQLSALAGCDILNKHVITKHRMDGEDVLTNVTNFKAISGYFTESDVNERVVGDGMYEEIERIIPYIEQYDRNVKDKAHSWFKGTAGDNEQPVSEAWWSWIPGVGK